MIKKLIKLSNKRLMIFARWSRKSDAAFLSLGRVIKISVLTTTYFILNAFNTIAQTDTLKIEEITVSAFKSPVSFSNVPRIISIASSKEISEAPLNGINDALKSLMNIDVRERGAYGVQADINFRGGSFEQNAVFLNGVRMNDPQTGHFQMNMPVELSDLSRIEVIHGAASSVFGNNAFSSAINLITGIRDDRSLKATIFAGENELYGGSLSLNISDKKMANYLSVSKKVSSGYIEDTDFDILNIFYNSKLFTKAGDLQLQLGILDKSFGAYSFYTPLYPNQYEQNITKMANLKFFSNNQVKVNPSVYWRRNNDRFELFRDNPPTWYTTHNYHQTDVYGTDINTQFAWFLGKASLGLDWNTESIISNKLGDPLDYEINIRNEDSVFYDHGKSRQNISTYFENHYNIKKLNISASMMANWNSMFGWNFYPGIDFLYHVGKNWNALASFNISGRLPSYTDLYYVGPGNQGNISLTPEKSINYEIGTKYINSLLNLQSSIFYRQGINIIDWVKADASQLWQSANITTVNTIGYEIIAKFDFSEKYGEHFPLLSMSLAYTYLDMKKNSSEYISKYVLDYLRHNANIVLNHKITTNFTASWMLNLQFRNGNYIPYNHSTLSWEPATSYLPLYLLDLKLNYQFKYVDLFIQGKNILDQDQQNIENVQLPGRWISGGIIINLKFK